MVFQNPKGLSPIASEVMKLLDMITDVGFIDGEGDGCKLGRRDGWYEGKAVGLLVGGSRHTYKGASLPSAALGKRTTHPMNATRAEGDLMVV